MARQLVAFGFIALLAAAIGAGIAWKVKPSTDRPFVRIDTTFSAPPLAFIENPDAPEPEQKIIYRERVRVDTVRVPVPTRLTDGFVLSSYRPLGITSDRVRWTYFDPTSSQYETRHFSVPNRRWHWHLDVEAAVNPFFRVADFYGDRAYLALEVAGGYRNLQAFGRLQGNLPSFEVQPWVGLRYQLGGDQ